MYKHTNCCVKNEGHETKEVLGTNHRTANGKLIVTALVCVNCGRRFSFKRGRVRCPLCQGILIVKTI